MTTRTGYALLFLLLAFPSLSWLSPASLLMGSASARTAPRTVQGASADSSVQEGQEQTAKWKRTGKFLNDAAICADCHEDEAEAIAVAAHKRVPHTKGLHACETCHGPGTAHADDQEASQITHPARLGRMEQEALCASCHRTQIAEHGGPLEELFLAGKKCTTCHKVHRSSADAPLAKRSKRFTSRKALVAKELPVGTKRCASCHSKKPESLRAHGHAKILDTGKRSRACESCHGSGAAHVETHGIPRFITRPDLAEDGVETCRSCHSEVDPVELHWKGRHSPLLTKGLRCTTCHSIHGRTDQVPSSAAKSSGERRASKLRTCLRCHGAAEHALKGSIHESVEQDCLACHEGGEAHARSGGKKALVSRLAGTSRMAQERACLSCHAKDRQPCKHRFGVHDQSDISCLHCHGPADPAPKRKWLKTVQRRCESCHSDVAAEFRRPRAHPIGEGRVSCSSCHDPHAQGKVRVGSSKAASDACVRCHKEYRSPFVFEHRASLEDGCMACHFPHGGANRKLLRTRNARDNCLSCHADAPSFHDQSQGSKFRNCVSCHVRIHGSNRHRFFFK